MKRSVYLVYKQPQSTGRKEGEIEVSYTTTLMKCVQTKGQWLLLVLILVELFLVLKQEHLKKVLNSQLLELRLYKHANKEKGNKNHRKRRKDRRVERKNKRKTRDRSTERINRKETNSKESREKR
jgi:hypothetical protein